MSIRLGTNIVAGRSSYQPSLFDFKWADHILNDPQWVRADNFIWHSRSTFTPAYDHLVADTQGKDPQAETIEGITITYYLANDGHKVCLADQEDYLKALYTKTGVAWYYLINTETQTFKLPRTKWGFTGMRGQTSVGDYIEAGLPNITGYLSTGFVQAQSAEGAFSVHFPKLDRNIPTGTDTYQSGWGWDFNAANSSSVYGNSDTVQPQSTQMYLYFYIGNFTQTAIENTAGIVIEEVEELVDSVLDTQYQPNLLEFKWSDHILNDIQWLRSDTFSWQSGDVYEVVYNHLVDDIEGKTLQTETISGVTISYYLADDGHKICPASEESDIVTLYTNTGVAWYYILDTTNTRFKLPRTTRGFEGIRNAAGSYIEAGLPQHTHDENFPFSEGIRPLVNAFNAESTAGTPKSITQNITHVSNDSLGVLQTGYASSSIYGASTTVQPPATEMYLYFYVGNYTREALVNTAGIAAEQLNTLTADVTDLNSHRVIAYQEPTAANNYTWYRKYADGWIEQGGIAASGSSSVTFPIAMADANYYFNALLTVSSTLHVIVSNYTTTGCTVEEGQYATGNRALTNTAKWEVKGIAAA